MHIYIKQDYFDRETSEMKGEKRNKLIKTLNNTL